MTIGNKSIKKSAKKPNKSSYDEFFKKSLIKTILFDIIFVTILNNHHLTFVFKILYTEKKNFKNQNFKYIQNFAEYLQNI